MIARHPYDRVADFGCVLGEKGRSFRSFWMFAGRVAEWSAARPEGDLLARRSISKAVQAFKSVPDIREKEVARARMLVRRKDYPSDRILRRVAERILEGRLGD